MVDKKANQENAINATTIAIGTLKPKSNILLTLYNN